MARENQLLQIALIIFVMIAVVLGVVTFLNFRKYEETLVQLKEQKRTATESQEKATALSADIATLKGFIGMEDAKSVADTKEQFVKDMKAWADKFPEKDQFYRTALQHMFDVLKTTNVSLADAKAELEKFKVQYVGREATRDPEIVQHKKAADTEAADLAAERTKFNDQLAQTKKDEAEALKKETDEIKADGDARLKLVAEAQRWKNDVKASQKVAQDAVKRTNVLMTPIPDRASLSGEVVYCSQSMKTVWINLGSADELHRLTTFAVYSGDTTNIDKAEKKASIEVAKILDAHLSECRILEDQNIDPIVPGDKIWTKAWSPGQKIHFVLAGKMDVNDDGRDHINDLRLRITASGGVVDAWLSNKDPKAHGAVTGATNYLVLGKSPDEHDSADYRNAWTTLQKQAETLGIEKIQAKDLIKQMGAENNQFRAVRFGKGANEADFRPDPGPTGPRPSGYPVSDIFMPRQPPKAQGTSAY